MAATSAVALWAFSNESPRNRWCAFCNDRGSCSFHTRYASTIVFSAMEGVFAYFWLFSVRADVGIFALGPVTTGAIILSVGLLAEHIVQGSMLGKEDRPDRMLPA